MFEIVNTMVKEMTNIRKIVISYETNSKDNYHSKLEPDETYKQNKNAMNGGYSYDNIDHMSNLNSGKFKVSPKQNVGEDQSFVINYKEKLTDDVIIISEDEDDEITDYEDEGDVENEEDENEDDKNGNDENEDNENEDNENEDDENEDNENEDDENEDNENEDDENEDERNNEDDENVNEDVLLKYKNSESIDLASLSHTDCHLSVNNNKIEDVDIFLEKNEDKIKTSILSDSSILVEESDLINLKTKENSNNEELLNVLNLETEVKDVFFENNQDNIEVTCEKKNENDISVEYIEHKESSQQNENIFNDFTDLDKNVDSKNIYLNNENEEFLKEENENIYDMIETEIEQKKVDRDFYKKMNIQQLRTIVISKGLVNDTTGMRKNDLVKLLENSGIYRSE